MLTYNEAASAVASFQAAHPYLHGSGGATPRQSAAAPELLYNDPVPGGALSQLLWYLAHTNDWVSRGVWSAYRLGVNPVESDGHLLEHLTFSCVASRYQNFAGEADRSAGMRRRCPARIVGSRRDPSGSWRLWRLHEHIEHHEADDDRHLPLHPAVVALAVSMMKDSGARRVQLRQALCEAGEQVEYCCRISPKSNEEEEASEMQIFHRPGRVNEPDVSGVHGNIVRLYRDCLGRSVSIPGATQEWRDHIHESPNRCDYVPLDCSSCDGVRRVEINEIRAERRLQESKHRRGRVNPILRELKIPPLFCKTRPEVTPEDITRIRKVLSASLLGGPGKAPIDKFWDDVAQLAKRNCSEIIESDGHTVVLLFDAVQREFVDANPHHGTTVSADTTFNIFHRNLRMHVGVIACSAPGSQVSFPLLWYIYRTANEVNDNHPSRRALVAALQGLAARMPVDIHVEYENESPSMIGDASQDGAAPRAMTVTASERMTVLSQPAPRVRERTERQRQVRTIVVDYEAGHISGCLDVMLASAAEQAESALRTLRSRRLQVQTRAIPVEPHHVEDAELWDDFTLLTPRSLTSRLATLSIDSADEIPQFIARALNGLLLSPPALPPDQSVQLALLIRVCEALQQWLDDVPRAYFQGKLPEQLLLFRRWKDIRARYSCLLDGIVDDTRIPELVGCAFHALQVNRRRKIPGVVANMGGARMTPKELKDSLITRVSMSLQTDGLMNQYHTTPTKRNRSRQPTRRGITPTALHRTNPATSGSKQSKHHKIRGRIHCAHATPAAIQLSRAAHRQPGIPPWQDTMRHGHTASNAHAKRPPW